MAHARVPTNKAGIFALVDVADLERVSAHRWHVSMTANGDIGSVNTNIPGVGRTSMHRLLLPGHPEVDHINGNPLDNRRNNLRPATHMQNTQNRKRQRNNTSGFKGVYWDRNKARWRVQIHAGDRRIYGGVFADLVDVAKAYDELALTHHGEFARLNFPIFGQVAHR